MLEKYKFTTKQPGKNLLILAAIHGNETAGTKAIYRIIEEINQNKHILLRGSLTLVPICNPEAYKNDVRQIEENLNRVMKLHEKPITYEQKLANEICPLIRSSDVMLDLHSTHCKEDTPFAFCDYPNQENLQIISSLPVEYVLRGWPDIYEKQSIIQDFSTEHAAHSYGHSGITIECGYHKSSTAIEIAYQSIINTLAEFSMIRTAKPVQSRKKHILMQSYTIKQHEGKFLKNYKHLDPLNKGEEIAIYNNNEIISAPDDGYILLPNHNAPIGAEWFYLGTDKL